MEDTRRRGWWVCGHVVGPEVECDGGGSCGDEGLEGTLGRGTGGGGGGDGDGDDGGVGPDSDEVEEGTEDGYEGEAIKIGSLGVEEPEMVQWVWTSHRDQIYQTRPLYVRERERE